jgi:hypothetical protein
MLSSFYLAADGCAPRLRVGLVLDGEILPRHYAAILDDIRGCDFAGLELLLLAAPRVAGGEGGRVARALRSLADPSRRPFFFYDLYERWDARRGMRGGPFAPVLCADRLRGVDRLEVHAVRTGDAEDLPASELESIRDRRLDVLLDLSAGGLGHGLESCARYGVWSFRWGGARKPRVQPFLWELIDGDAVSEVALEARLAAPGRRFTLSKALAPTEQTISASRNGAAAVAETTHFVVWKLHDLHRHGWQHVEAAALEDGAGRSLPGHDGPPRNGDMARFLGNRAARMAGIAVKALFRHQTWQVGIRAAGPQICDPAGEASVRGFRWFTPAPGHYWADPFIVPWRGKHFLFVEDFTFAKRVHLGELNLRDGRGVISCAEVLPSGELGPMEEVLHAGCHLSYPMVFPDGDEMYLVPESGHDQQVALYRATRFPGGWEKVAVLFDQCRAVDTTVHHQDGTWWFFTTVSDGHGSLKLLLFYADSLTGEWHQHPSNPISSDARFCRGAGPIIQQGGRWLRPSQSCVPSYGHSFALNEIVELTRSGYRERPWRVVEPDPALGLLGTHQYSRCDRFEVIDRCVSSGPLSDVRGLFANTARGPRSALRPRRAVLASSRR